MGKRKTPLHGRCLEAGAKMVEFAGWEMPIQFDGVLQEHKAVRKSCGLFDISHMGVITLRGEQAKEALQNLVPSDLFRIGAGQACYTVLTNEKGGIIDDLIVYDNGFNQENVQELHLVINAATAQKDIEWITDHSRKYKADVVDKKGNGVLLALQGPESELKLEAVIKKNLKELPSFGHQTFFTDHCGEVMISRTGYTGEDGFELLMGEEEGKHFWDLCQASEVQLCGLAARDILRLEAGMHLYGNDITEETTPFETGLGWLVHLEMPKDFVGRKCLEEQAEGTIQQKLICIKMDERAIPRRGYNIEASNGEVVGKITSGGWSPTLEAGIAFAFVNQRESKCGTRLSVDIRGQQIPCKVVKRPFVRGRRF